jgi:hypothetical protein
MGTITCMIRRGGGSRLRLFLSGYLRFSLQGYEENAAIWELAHTREWHVDDCPSCQANTSKISFTCLVSRATKAWKILITRYLPLGTATSIRRILLNFNKTSWELLYENSQLSHLRWAMLNSRYIKGSQLYGTGCSYGPKIRIAMKEFGRINKTSTKAAVGEHMLHASSSHFLSKCSNSVHSILPAQSQAVSPRSPCTNF